ncbi:DUF2799 domain-containing protein [Amphiplicatus metriothermophilus]|uniref:DUF2799 domain-containing protein n=1 Tax=Amphiplicatus metriothermophilus TaxID=1519374 RepID=A0A239PIU4_9PROT|nr:DUF2799 domain-containing protein [Amphiplicatus metriothermophilus]MBB5517935.1 DNA repair exonuclease SbcCD ATPase subunit [Amphiplicatus metriothermophilus]SNT67732.1 Protein of unknown function [Amphiplicatus metriothermophilus]
MNRRLGLAAALVLSGCATGMSEEECAGANWRAIGERDGLYGETLEKLDERAAQCGSFGLPADIEAYQAGRERGLRRYCTPDAGFDAGLNGRPYRGVCPPPAESAFLDEYDIGLRLYRLTRAHESAIEAYEDALDALESRRHGLRRARAKLRSEDLSDEERSKLQREIDRHRREIDRIERDLPRLSAEIDSALGRLEDYRAFLRRRR